MLWQPLRSLEIVGSEAPFILGSLHPDERFLDAKTAQAWIIFLVLDGRHPEFEVGQRVRIRGTLDSEREVSGDADVHTAEVSTSLTHLSLSGATPLEWLD